MSKFVLVVDDVFINRDILCEMLEEKYDVIQASDGVEALDCIEKYNNQLLAVLLDLMMPNLSGIQVLQRLQDKQDFLKKVPVLVITGEDDIEIETECFKYGIYDFIKKPFNEQAVNLRVQNAIELYTLKNSLENKIQEQTQELKEKNERLLSINNDIVELMGNVVEARDNESGLHVKRVKSYTNLLANAIMKYYPEYNLTVDDVEIITSVSALHDLGKIMISDTILRKPGKLTDEEKELMKQHTTYGCEVMANAPKDILSNLYYKYGYDICKGHHERYDGNGYPNKLVGDEIPIAAQIVGLADAYDAMVTERVYKKAIEPKKAYRMIKNGECGAFSPKILDCFDKCKDMFEETLRRLSDGD